MNGSMTRTCGTSGRSIVDDLASEKELQEMVEAVAEANGWLVYHDVDSRRNRAGFPDLVMVKDGDALFVELKTKKGRVSKAQQAWVEALQGVETFTAEIVRPGPALTALVGRLLR